MRDRHRGNLAEKAIQVYGSQGAGGVAKRVFVKLRRSLFRRNAAIWYGRDLLSPLPAGRDGVPGTFSPIVPRALGEWLRESKKLAWAADPRELELASRLEHEWTCWRLCGEIAAFCKIGHGRVFVVDFDRAIALPERVAFLSDVYVLAEARRRGIANRLLLATMDLFRENSFVAIACHIPESNRPSIRLFTSLGFCPLGEVRFTKILGLPVFSAKPETMLERAASLPTDGGSPAGTRT